MQNEETQPQRPTTDTDTTPTSATRGTHPYHEPMLTNFGSLVELVQRRGGYGRDGGGFPDCTFS
jgi:hypothetical protein